MGHDDDRLFEALARPRFSTRAFPPYRFVPGRHPHPTASPAGHSYHAPGHSEPPVRFVPPEDWRNSEDYLYGCDLYNHAFWWEAHEAWEGLWHLPERGSVQRNFLQGLIQVSACHLKLRLGHMDGVARLREGSATYLRGVCERVGNEPFMGLRVAEFVADVDRYYDVVYSAGESSPAHRPEIFPYCMPA